MAENYASDFASVIEEVQNGQKPPRDIPPLHPKEREKWVNLAEEDPLPGMSAASNTEHNLLTLPNRKLSAKYERYSFGDPLAMERLEEIQSRCLQAGSGYFLTREEWTHDKDGETYILIKYMVDEKSAPLKKGYTYTRKRADDDE